MDLCLVHNEVAGGPAALELLRAALLGTELFILPVVEGESRGGEPTVAGGARERCQRVLLGMDGERKRKRKNTTQSPDGQTDRGCSGAVVFPSLSLFPT